MSAHPVEIKLHSLVSKNTLFKIVRNFLCKPCFQYVFRHSVEFTKKGKKKKKTNESNHAAYLDQLLIASNLHHARLPRLFSFLFLFFFSQQLLFFSTVLVDQILGYVFQPRVLLDGFLLRAVFSTIPICSRLATQNNFEKT